MYPEVRKLSHVPPVFIAQQRRWHEREEAKRCSLSREGCDTCLLKQLALIWAAQRSRLFMQIKGQWQAGMWLQAILVRTSPGALVQASDSQFVFLHELSGQALAGKKKISAMGVDTVRIQMQFFLWLRLICRKIKPLNHYFKKQPNSELFAQYLIGPCVG